MDNIVSLSLNPSSIVLQIVNYPINIRKLVKLKKVCSQICNLNDSFQVRLSKLRKTKMFFTFFSVRKTIGFFGTCKIVDFVQMKIK